MASQSPRYFARGDISPCRFLQPDTSTNFGVLQVDTAATDMIIGVSQEGTRRAPGTGSDDGYAAISGETLLVHGPGEECLIEAGGSFAAGALLKSDGSGKAVASTLAEAAGTKVWIAGRALEDSTGSGQKIRMFFDPQVVVTA